MTDSSHKVQVRIDATLSDVLKGKSKAPMDYVSFSKFCAENGASAPLSFCYEIIKKTDTFKSIGQFENFIYTTIDVYFQNGAQILGIPDEMHRKLMTQYPLAMNMAAVIA